MTGREKHLENLRTNGFCETCGMTRSGQGGVADYSYGNPNALECSKENELTLFGRHSIKVLLIALISLALLASFQ